MIDQCEQCLAYMLFNTFSPSVHTASLLPRGLFSFLRNIKLLQLNNNYGKTEEYTYFIFFGLQLEPNFPKQELLSNLESIMFIVLYYSTHSAAPWWPLQHHYHHHHHTITSSITVMSLSCNYLFLCGEKGTNCSPQGSHSDTWGPAVLPSGPADPACIAGLYY